LLRKEQREFEPPKKKKNASPFWPLASGRFRGKKERLQENEMLKRKKWPSPPRGAAPRWGGGKTDQDQYPEEELPFGLKRDVRNPKMAVHKAPQEGERGGPINRQAPQNATGGVFSAEVSVVDLPGNTESCGGKPLLHSARGPSNCYTTGQGGNWERMINWARKH